MELVTPKNHLESELPQPDILDELDDASSVEEDRELKNLKNTVQHGYYHSYL